MKTRDLSELLAKRPIVHPTRIDGISWRGRKLTIAVSGYRWWDSPQRQQAEGTISLVFDGVGDGRLVTDEFDLDDDEALEDFEISLVSTIPWAQSRDWSVYCSGPIGQPLTLFGRVYDYLHSHDAFRTPEYFLNQAADLSRFAAMARTNGFLLGHGPDCIRDLMCDELDRQAVPHNVVSRVADTAAARFLVRLGNSAFFCESAVAELPR